ncbi:MAG: putative Ig domain-containing protein, partial [Thermoplasmata archaeon]|nr:putative Ig domain-containing protein [Thermoplasmata archaeon]
ITLDNLTALEDIYYEVLYEYKDIDVANVGQPIFWNYSSNASWLSFDNITAILNGTPTNDDVGSYWVNITINDTMEIDFTNFTLTVIEVNGNPIINTIDDEITYEDELYEVDYNATDIDSALIDQIWSLETNASSWLDIDSSGIISGTPTNDEVGIYWVNVSVDDGENGLDFTNFSLTVLNVNDPPVIVTADLQTAPADTLYEVDYNATDIDSPLSQQIWSLNTNATWLGLDTSTGVLSGTPTEADAGWYNVNVSVDDGDGAQDWQEFVLTVTIGMKNEPPVITTTDVVSATVDELYYVDYTAIDDYTPFDQLIWALDTDANWLSIETNTGTLSGTPIVSEVGQYWANVSVMDEHHAVSFHNFTLTVTKEPIDKNIAPELLSPKMTPPAGDIETIFTFTVHYYDADDDVPEYVQLVIDGILYNMMLATSDPSNGTYEYKTKLSKGIHTYYFTASDGLDLVRTDDFNTSIIKGIGENTAPELSNPKMTFSEGDIEIEFTFSVHYQDADGDIPEFVRVAIDGIDYNMELKPGETPADGIYEYKINLSQETHIYNFTASDGIDIVKTNDFTTSYDGKKGDKSSQEDTSWAWLILIVVIVIIIVLAVVFFVIRNKRTKEREEPEPELA